MKLYSWLHIFQNMEEHVLFEIIRHYLGAVKTPYHKPKLIEKLDQFFSREDIINQTLKFISKEEAILLTYIAFGKKVSFLSLSSVLSESSPGNLNRQLLNLEERLLIWQNHGKANYRITPLCQAAIDSGIVGPGVILGEGTPIKPSNIEESSNYKILNDSLFIAILSFLTEEKSLLLKKNGFKKRGLKAIRERFPLLFQKEKGEKRVFFLGQSLIFGGLAYRDGETLKADRKEWQKLEELNYKERRILIITHLLAFTRIPFSERIILTRTIIEGLPKNRFYQRKNFEHLLQLLFGSKLLIVQRIVATLALFNELILKENGTVCILNFPETDIKNDSYAMNINPIGDMTLHPAMRFNYDLALATELLRFDVVPTFQINKKRFLKALSLGIHVENLQNLIYTCSHRKLPETLRVLMTEWKSSYNALNLQYAAILRVSEKHQSLLDESGVLNPYILQECGNGLWLLDPKQEDDWREALASIGFEYIPFLPNSKNGIEDRKKSVKGKSSYNEEDFRNPIHIFSTSWEPPQFQDYTDTLSLFKSQTNDRNLESNELQELEERLVRKIILLSEQIRPEEWRYETVEAKGLDYQGKIRLINATMNSRNEELLLTLPEQTKFQEIRVKPEKIERDGDGHVLICKSLPEEENLRIKVRKVSYMRKMRLSLF